jgi:hypothetical protein
MEAQRGDPTAILGSPSWYFRHGSGRSRGANPHFPRDPRRDGAGRPRPPRSAKPSTRSSAGKGDGASLPSRMRAVSTPWGSFGSGRRPQ